MEKKFYIIYKTTCSINNKIYIGQHSTDNLEDDYLGSGTLLKEDIKKFGKQFFKKEVISIFETWEEMDAKEAEIVDIDFVARNDTYNCQLGGFSKKESNFNFLKFAKLGTLTFLNKYRNDKEFKKMCDEKRNKMLADIEVKKRISNSLILRHKEKGHPWDGRRHNKETKAKIGKQNSIKQKGEKNSQYGKHWIYNEDLKMSKSIKKNELSNWLNDGWLKGRKMF